MIKLEICVGSSCYLKGAQSIIDFLQKKIKEEDLSSKVELVGAFCLGNCGNGITIKINNEIKQVIDAKQVEDILNKTISEAESGNTNN